jgi:serine protease Do
LNVFASPLSILTTERAGIWDAGINQIPPVIHNGSIVFKFMKTKMKLFALSVKKMKSALAVMAVFAVAAGTVLVTIAATPAPRINYSDKAIDRTGQQPASFSPVVKKVSASVVNIYSTRRVNVPSFRNPFQEDWLREFFGGNAPEQGSRPRTQKQQGLGSGVIISEDGYILSNAHVVEKADDIKVSLADDTAEYNAKLIGSDPQTDIAVLKIEAKNLTPITLADSDKLEVGDVVLAVGNPFGVGQTVTRGIISALGRGGLGIVDYEDFIQTDAAINPGNSGGALVDIEGRLIGINQSIASRTGGSQGVGFAVPVNLARSVMDRIVTEGVVRRGFLGINPQDVTPDLAEAFKLPNQSGVLVSGVYPETPASKAGLEPGDVILELNGRKMNDARHLRLTISQTKPGTKVPVKLMRDGKERTVTVTLDTLSDDTVVGTPLPNGKSENNNVSTLQGVEFTDLDARVRRQFDIPANITGALITQVEPDSAAQEAGLRPGDVIVEVRGQSVDNASQTLQAIRKSKGEKLLLRVWNPAGGRGATRYIVVRPDESR